MQILYHKTEPTFLNIWLIRFFVGVESLLLLGVIFKLFTTEESGDIVSLIALLLVLCRGLMKESAKHIAYLDEEEIVLKGVFEDITYNYSDFGRVSPRYKLYGVMCMEFSDRMKYNLAYKEMANGYGNLFEDYKIITSGIELRVHGHLSN